MRTGGLRFGRVERAKYVPAEEKCGEDAGAHDGGGHGVAGEVGHLVVVLAGEKKVVDWDALETKEIAS